MLGMRVAFVGSCGPAWRLDISASSYPALLHTALFQVHLAAGDRTPDLLFPARSCLGETGTFHRNCGFGMLISLSLDLCKRDGFTLPMTPTLSEVFQIIDRLFVWCVDSRTPPMKVADPVEGVPTVRF